MPHHRTLSERLAPAGLRRRELILAGLLAPLPCQANLALLMRLFIGFGMRSGVGRAAAGTAMRAGMARGAAAAARSAATTVRSAGIRGGTVTAASAATAPMSGATRLASAMRPARRLGSGAAAAAPGGAGAVDMAMLAFDASHLLATGSLPPEVQVSEPIDILQVQVDGKNVTQGHLNGALSLLLFDEAFANGGEGRFHRVVLGTAASPPSAALQLAHEFDLSGWGDERLLIAPTLTTLSSDETDRSVVFDPPLLVIDFQKG